MRKYLRQMAKARMKAIGVERINRHMADFWRQALDDPEAENQMMKQGMRRKAQREFEKAQRRRSA